MCLPRGTRWFHEPDEGKWFHLVGDMRHRPVCNFLIDSTVCSPQIRERWSDAGSFVLAQGYNLGKEAGWFWKLDPMCERWLRIRLEEIRDGATHRTPLTRGRRNLNFRRKDEAVYCEFGHHWMGLPGRRPHDRKSLTPPVASCPSFLILPGLSHYIFFP